MKYIEQVKSMILFLLVLLSITLTFSIWTYKPSYETLEQEPIVDISISEKRNLDEVIKPYKIVYRLNDVWKGTTSSSTVDQIMSEIKNWEVTDLGIASNGFTEQQLNEEMLTNNRVTLFYSGEIPFPVFQNLLPFQSKKLPESTFDRLTIDWGDATNKEMSLYFINTNNKQLYKAKMKIKDEQHFNQNIIQPAMDLENYVEIPRENRYSLYISNRKKDTVQYTYFLEDIPPDRFKEALFVDPNLVQRNPDSGLASEKYTDGTALMTVDFKSRSLHYVQPAAESSDPAIPSKLLLNSFDIINEHGGWTDEYRYKYMNAEKQQVVYQLYLHGYPVFSDVVMTDITQYWGNGKIFKYIRPYYKVDLALSTDKGVKELPSGEEIVSALKNVKGVDFNRIEELTIGYHMKFNDVQSLLTLEPAWYFKVKGNWTHVTTELLGGGQLGLE